MGNQPRTLVRVRLTVEFFAEVPDAALVGLLDLLFPGGPNDE